RRIDDQVAGRIEIEEWRVACGKFELRIETDLQAGAGHAQRELTGQDDVIKQDEVAAGLDDQVWPWLADDRIVTNQGRRATRQVDAPLAMAIRELGRDVVSNVLACRVEQQVEIGLHDDTHFGQAFSKAPG